MKKISHASEAVNNLTLPRDSVVYTGGNAASPQALIKELISNTSIRDIELVSLLLLGDIADIFSEESCKRITHRIIFNGPFSRKAINNGWASYQLMHLSDIPYQIHNYLQPDVVFVCVSGPDKGGNYSLGTTVIGELAAVRSAKKKGGIVIAERNARMPFVLGTTITEKDIDYLLDTEYDLPVSPVHHSDEKSLRIGEIIAQLYIHDGSTLQYGIGEVPEAVNEAVIKKGVKDLGIHTELFADAMRMLIEKGIVTNKYLEDTFSTATLFLSGSKEGYDWLHYNSSVQGRPSNISNNIINIARQPKMTAINSAIGFDLHGNIWADSMNAHMTYSGIGGQSDFLRGAYLSEGGIPIIGMKASTAAGTSKINPLSPAGVAVTAIAADPVILVTEYGAFDPRGLNMDEHAIGISHLAAPDHRDALLKYIYDSPDFHKTKNALKDRPPKGFIAYDQIC